jgi:hypothetical protein
MRYDNGTFTALDTRDGRRVTLRMKRDIEKLDASESARLRDLCKHIVDDPQNVDDDTKVAFKAATMKYARTLHDDPAQALEVLYHDQDGMGSLVRKAVEIVEEADRTDDVTKAHEHRGHHALTGALVRHLHEALERRRERRGYQKSEKELPMTSHSEFVQSVVKQYGIVALAKSMVKDQKSYGLDELSFTQLATEHAQRVYPNDRPDVAFSKLFEGEESVRRARNISKIASAAFDVTIVTPGDATYQTVNDTEQSEAYQQLEALASKLHAAATGKLTKEQAFARAFEANPALAAKAHRRPTPPPGGAYPVPR